MTVVNSEHIMMSEEERLQMIEDIFIRHPQFEKLSETIAECHQKSRRSAEPKCLFITGVSGSGKSTLARHYASQFPRHPDAEGSVVPVVTSTIFAPATVKGIATGLLYSLGDPIADKGTITSQTTRLYGFIKKCRVEMIILDEFQHLIDRDSDKVLEVASDWLKNLINVTRKPMVLMGMPGAVRILNANEQLRRRFAARKDLSPFGWKTADQRKEFRGLLKLIESKLPLEESSNLSDPETALRFFCASQGVMSHVMTIVRSAAIMAVRRGMEKIDLNLLAEAYEEDIASIDPNEGNPFLVDAEHLKVRPLKEEMGGIKVKKKKRKLSEIF